MSATIETNAAGKTVLKCFNPATGEPLRELEAHSIEDVDQAIERLLKAAAGYNHVPIKERVRVVRKFRKHLARNLDLIIDSVCTETGKKPSEALVEIFGALEIIRFAEKLAPKVLQRHYRSSGTVIHKRAYVEYRPHGVAAMISPWNYPMLLVAAPAAEALAAGNTVIAKPSEHASLTTLLIKELFDEATGWPELLEVVLGAVEVGQRLVTSPGTDVVCFTGSTQAGRAIAHDCAENLKPVILELGGNDPLIVLEDANLKRAAKSAVWGGFTNAGQTCVSVERVYVVESVFEEFMQLLREECKKLTVGGKAEDTIGAVTVEVQYDKIMNHLEDAKAKGAQIETFGITEGRHLAPALLTKVDHSMAIMTDETFGPTLAVMPVASEDEAIRMANDTRFGLSAYIFTKSERRAQRVARQLECGAVAFNDVIVQYGMAALPIGGFKDSGLGKFHGREGLLSFSREQSVAASRVRLPMELWWYDLGKRTYKGLRTFIKWRYS
jgi:acyl-CoA reductase-like NAD-dependent aldehyde dehydrogenase